MSLYRGVTNRGFAILIRKIGKLITVYILLGYGADIDRRISEPFLTIPLKLKPAETDQLQRDTRRICLTPVLGGKKYDSMKTTRGITKFNRGATSPLDSRYEYIYNIPYWLLSDSYSHCIIQN